MESSDVISSRLVDRYNCQVVREAAVLVNLDDEVRGVAAWDSSVFNVDDAILEERVGHVRLG